MSHYLVLPFPALPPSLWCVITCCCPSQPCHLLCDKSLLGIILPSHATFSVMNLYLVLSFPALLPPLWWNFTWYYPSKPCHLFCDESLLGISLPSLATFSVMNLYFSEFNCYSISDPCCALKYYPEVETCSKEIEGQLESERKYQERLIAEDFGSSTIGKIRYISFSIYHISVHLSMYLSFFLYICIYLSTYIQDLLLRTLVALLLEK